MARGRARHGGVAAVLLAVVLAGCTTDSSTSARPTSTAKPTDSDNDSGTGAGTGSGSGSEGVEGLVFGPCGDLLDPVSIDQLPAERADRLSFECGVLDVPIDHDAPDGEHLGIAVVRIRDSSQTDRIGSLVMNPGGPGNPGLGFAPYWASWLPEEVLERFDVVTFDPRGVGASGGFNCPAIPQDAEPEVLADLVSPSGYAFTVEVSKAQAASCLEELGTERAAQINTQATAQDMDLLREALGDERLTYLGFSYGAKLGAEYARAFPDRIRALVLDAPTHPRDDPIAIIERQVAAFEAAYDSWVDNCPERPSCKLNGDDPRAFVDGLMARARESPIPSGRSVGDVPASDATIMSAITASLYYEQFWGILDEALGEAALGDSGSLREAIDNWLGRVHDPEQPETPDANLVINCTDARPGPGKQAILAAARRLSTRFPMFGTYGQGWLVGCKYWTGERHALPVPRAVGAPPIVVVGTRHDPATPYAGAVAMAKTLGSGHLLTWEGHTHTAYGQTDCITEAVDAYLVDLVVPPAGTTCPD
ncbi:MAG: alpha/beta hydrolase [Nocardioides sp.]